MLSAASRPYIEASVPVLREHGLAITRHFYAAMFAAHPELKNLFNMGNQANGAQQVSLASALFAYAANIDNSAALAPVASRIAHKHASVGLKPAHYPIVARYLLAAIKEVLGASATPELLVAWDEAYWLLAGELIAAEARLIERAGPRNADFVVARVTEVRRECEDVISYYLQTEEGRSPGSFKPGQYVSIAVDFADGSRQIRQYSLSDAPEQNHWRITVKRELAPVIGRVASHLLANVQRGGALLVSAAYGDFHPSLASERPLALISAGVGITPMISALHALPAHDTRPVLFAYAARSVSHHPLRTDLTQAHQRLANLRSQVWYEDAEGLSKHGDGKARHGRMELTQGLIDAYQQADFYLCGPLAFMREQWRSLLALGIAPERLHREVFGPEACDHLS